MKKKNKSFFRNKYRIVADTYLGWEVQYKRWYWPFWETVNFSNTFSKIEEAEAFAKSHNSKIYLNL